MEYREPIDGEVIASFSRKSFFSNNLSQILVAMLLLFLTYVGIKISYNVINFQVEAIDCTYQEYCYISNLIGESTVDEVKYQEVLNSKEGNELFYKINHGILSVLLRYSIVILILYFIVYQLVIKSLEEFGASTFLKPLMYKAIVYKKLGFKTLRGERFDTLYTKEIVYLGTNRIKVGDYNYDVSAPFNSDMVTFIKFLKQKQDEFMIKEIEDKIPPDFD